MPTIDVTSTPFSPRVPPALPASGESTAPSLKVRVNDWRMRVEELCREHPAQALAIALAAGFIVGRLIHVGLAHARAPERD